MNIAAVKISACECDCQIGYIKLVGRTTLEFGEQFKQSGMLLLDNGAKKLVVDLQECTFMDSTTMGVLTMLTLEAIKRKVQIVAANVPDEINALLSGLGITRVLSFTELNTDEVSWLDTESVDITKLNSKLILEAHQVLSDIDEANKQKFQHVIQCLESEINNS